MITTPGLWSHKWRPITFCLIVDDFVIEYIGKCITRHLRGVLKEHYTITEYWSGTKFAGIDLNWDYQQRTHRLSMKDYIRKLLLRHNHPTTTHRQLSPHCHVEINYGAKAQYTIEPAYSPPLDNASINHIQEIFGSLLLFACTVYYKILVTLSKIGTHQAAVTEQTNEAISQLLDYVVTYSNDGIIYRSSDRILAAHADGAYLNINRARSYAGAFSFGSHNCERNSRCRLAPSVWWERRLLKVTHTRLLGVDTSRRFSGAPAASSLGYEKGKADFGCTTSVAADLATLETVKDFNRAWRKKVHASESSTW